MAKDPLFALRVQALLRTRGLTAGPFDVVIMDRDGDVTLDGWNREKLGPKPQPATIAAVSDADAVALAKVDQRTSVLDDVRLRALARAIHVRFSRPDAATMDEPTWQAILVAAYDVESGKPPSTLKLPPVASSAASSR